MRLPDQHRDIRYGTFRLSETCFAVADTDVYATNDKKSDLHAYHVLSLYTGIELAEYNKGDKARAVL